jgi:hypothetical protein
MTPPRRGNIAASVRQRLLNRAREQREDFGLRNHGKTTREQGKCNRSL